MVKFRNLKKESSNGKLSREKPPVTDSEMDFRKLSSGKAKEPESTAGISSHMKSADPDIEILYKQACGYMQQALDSVRAKKKFALEPGFEIMQKIVEGFSAKDQRFVKVIPAIDPAKFVVSHAVNVAVYAIKMAADLGFSLNRQIEIGMAGMLHDIGMGVIPENIIYKKERLAEKEFKILKERPVYAYNILKAFGSEYGYLAEVALQIHERSDGSGYPKGLKEHEIHEYAQIIGLVDIYEAMIHSRPHREKFLHFVAVKEIIKTGKNQFRRKYLKVLLNVFSIFPVNSYVRLNSNAIGRIIETYPDQPMRPRLEIEFDSENRRVLSERIIDLRENSLLYISDSLSEEELMEISAAAELVDRPGRTELDIDDDPTLVEEDAEPIGQRVETENVPHASDDQIKKTGRFKLYSAVLALLILFVSGIIWQFGIKAPGQPKIKKTAIKIQKVPVNNQKKENKENTEKIKSSRPAVTATPAVKIIKITKKPLTKETTGSSIQSKEPVVIESPSKTRSPIGSDTSVEQKKVKPLYPFSIQLASYKTYEAAETGRAGYADTGISPYWVKVDLGNRGTWFRLFAGYFESLEQAEHAIKTYKLERAAAKKTEYSVFINSFKDINLMNSARQKLEQFGYSSYFIQRDTLYHLYVGAFFSIKGATDQCADLKSHGVPCEAVKR